MVNKNPELQFSFTKQTHKQNECMKFVAFYSLSNQVLAFLTTFRYYLLERFIFISYNVVLFSTLEDFSVPFMSSSLFIYNFITIGIKIRIRTCHVII